MMYYAVIDTNVLVSAMLKWDSVPGCVLEHTFVGDIIPLLNEQVLKEYIEVLSRPKFHFDKERVNIIIDGLVRRGVFVDAEITDEELPDPKDAVFYEGIAAELGASAETMSANVEQMLASLHIITELNAVISDDVHNVAATMQKTNISSEEILRQMAILERSSRSLEEIVGNFKV